MEKSLKDANRLYLYLVLLANFTFFYTVVEYNAITAGNWPHLMTNAGTALPAGFGIILTGILNAQLSAEKKSRVVFVRWRNPLPGCEAFSRYAKEDVRVDIAGINQLCGTLPEDPRQQNALWYKLYKSLDGEPSVVQVHRSFLFTRDYACIALMLTFTLGILGFFQIRSKVVATLYLLLLVAQFLITGQAARNHARRFVTTVLAIKAASQEAV